MKKIQWVILSAAVLVFLAAGCKSAPKQPELEEVNPYVLLDGQSSIYVGMSVQKHLDLTANILNAEISGLSVSDAKKIAEYIDILYAGVGTIKDRSRVQIAASGNYPVNLLKKFLTSKNGWNVQNYVAQSSDECKKLNYPYEFSTYSRLDDSEFEFSFTSPNILCAAQKVDPLLESYALRPSVTEDEISAWVLNPGDDIQFYIVRPGQYLQNLIGADLPISCKCIYGTLTYKPNPAAPDEYSKEYDLSFCLKLTNPRAIRGVLGALSLSLGMMGAEVAVPENGVIKITGVTVTERQITGLFTREKLQYKHYVPPKED